VVLNSASAALAFSLLALPGFVHVEVPGHAPVPATVFARFSSSPEGVREVEVRDARLAVEWPPGVEWIEVFTPVHAPCRVSASSDGPCVLAPLVRFRPFAGEGRVWVRESGKETRFRLLAPVPVEWGGGYALPESRYDVVVAPSKEAASLHEHTAPGVLNDVRREPSAPASAFRAAFVDRRGKPASPARVVPLPPTSAGSDPATRRQRAWVEFFRQVAPAVSPGGQLTLSPVPRDPVRFAAYAGGGLSVTFTVRALRPDREGTVDGGRIRLPAGSTLDVTLVSFPSDVEPQPRMQVALKLVRPLPGYGQPADTSATTRSLAIQETASLSGLVPGEWRLNLLADGVPLGRQIVLVGDEERVPVELHVTSESVAGRVEDREGIGLPGVQVVVAPPGGSRRPQAEAMTDEDGRFSLAFLHGGGPVLVSASLDLAPVPQSLEIDPRSQEAGDLRIVLPMAEVSLLVVDAETEAPIEGAQFDGTYSGESGAQPNVNLLSDGSGRIRLAGLDLVGEVSGLVKAERYATSDPVSVLIRDGAPTGPTTVRLLKASVVTGRVLSAAGPVRGATVTGPLELARHDDASPPLVVTTDTNGRFRMEVAPESTVTLAVWAPGYRLALTRARAAEETDVSLMPRGSDSVFELVNEEGRPVKGVSPSIDWQGVPIPSFVWGSAASASGCAYDTSGMEGTLLFGGCLGPGEYTLHVRFIRDGRFVERPAGRFTSPAPPVSRFVVLRAGERPRP